MAADAPRDYKVVAVVLHVVKMGELKSELTVGSLWIIKNLTEGGGLNVKTKIDVTDELKTLRVCVPLVSYTHTLV